LCALLRRHHDLGFT
jgi:hypothetical protein